MCSQLRGSVFLTSYRTSVTRSAIDIFKEVTYCRLSARSLTSSSLCFSKAIILSNSYLREVSHSDPSEDYCSSGIYAIVVTRSCRGSLSPTAELWLTYSGIDELTIARRSASYLALCVAILMRLLCSLSQRLLASLYS